MTDKTLNNLEKLMINYDEGYDDPQADIRYRTPSYCKAKKVFSKEQLDFVSSNLSLKDEPLEFYVRHITMGSCASLEISIMFKREGKNEYRELYFGDSAEPNKVKFYWKIEPKLKLNLKEWYNNWLNDPWR